MESHSGMIFAGKKPKNLEKNCPNVTLPTTSPTCTDLDVNLGLCGERLATNCMSYGMTYI
jgi:hypothetical protein